MATVKICDHCGNRIRERIQYVHLELLYNGLFITSTAFDARDVETSFDLHLGGCLQTWGAVINERNKTKAQDS